MTDTSSDPPRRVPAPSATDGCCSSSPARPSRAATGSGSTRRRCTRSPGRSPTSCATGVAGRGRRRRRQLLPRRRAVRARHGPRARRLHGHARHGHELPGAAGLPREARASRPGCRPRSPWARSPSRTSRAARSGTSRRAASSSSAPASARRTSPPTPTAAQRALEIGAEVVLMAKRRRRRLRRRPKHQPRRGEVRLATYAEVLAARAEGRRRDRHQPLHGQRAADRRLRPARRGQHRPRRPR